MLSVVHTTPFFFFFFNDTATTEIYTLSLHDALPISRYRACIRSRSSSRLHLADRCCRSCGPYEISHPLRLGREHSPETKRSEEHTSELQSRPHLVCRLLLEKKKKNKKSLW